jgi:hypothetical protein
MSQFIAGEKESMFSYLGITDLSKTTTFIIKSTSFNKVLVFLTID